MYMPKAPLVPIKSRDIVRYEGKLYLITSVKAVKSGGVVEMLPLGDRPMTVMADEITLANSQEVYERARLMETQPNKFLQPSRTHRLTAKDEE
jgi:hypothetical protein